MKIAILMALLVVSLVFIGCTQPIAEVTTPESAPASAEEQELNQGLDDVQQIEEVDGELNDINLDELENVDLE